MPAVRPSARNNRAIARGQKPSSKRRPRPTCLVSREGLLGLATECDQRLYDEIVVGFMRQAGKCIGCHSPGALHVYREGSAVGGIACLVKPTVVLHSSPAEPAPQAHQTHQAEPALQAHQQGRYGVPLCCPAVFLYPNLVIGRRSGRETWKDTCSFRRMSMAIGRFRPVTSRGVLPVAGPVSSRPWVGTARRCCH